ncbi:MAG: nuclear transport factor 2 family protein [Actinobacteria bacterium]|nr:nuclear transport factor 2 family protein [Actinomycetota bacterium]
MNQSFAQLWSETWNSHDADVIVRLYADDGIHQMAAGATYVGADELRPMVERSLRGYPDLEFSVRDHDVISAGSEGRSDSATERFVIEYTMTGTQLEAIGDREGTGKFVTIDGAMIGELTTTGRIARCIDYLDHHSIRRQLGLIE